MHAPRPTTVLAFGLGAALQPLIVVAGWVLLQINTRPRKGA